MKSQNSIVQKRLNRYGQIDNLWAFKNQVWRLAARIHELRCEGMEIETVFKNEKGKRNCKYILIKN